MLETPHPFLGNQDKCWFCGKAYDEGQHTRILGEKDGTKQ